jgi:hypothetical protein
MTWDYKLEIIVRSNMDQRAIELVMRAALKELEDKEFLISGKSGIRAAQSLEEVDEDAPLKFPILD